LNNGRFPVAIKKSFAPVNMVRGSTMLAKTASLGTRIVICFMIVSVVRATALFVLQLNMRKPLCAWAFEKVSASTKLKRRMEKSQSARNMSYLHPANRTYQS
jgi:hypothetical protein